MRFKTLGAVSANDDPNPPGTYYLETPKTLSLNYLNLIRVPVVILGIFLN